MPLEKEASTDKVFVVILDQKPFIYVWRPFYRLLFAPLILPFLVAFRNLFLADTRKALSELSSAVFALQQQCEFQQRLLAELRTAVQSFASTVERSEAGTARQWTEMEKLLLIYLSEARRD